MREDLYKCDVCGSTTQAPMDWLTIERAGIQVATFGEEPGPWDVCSEDCGEAVLRSIVAQRRAVGR